MEEAVERHVHTPAKNAAGHQYSSKCSIEPSFVRRSEGTPRTSLTAHIKSVSTRSDALPSLAKPTSAPNNTPNQSPLTSPIKQELGTAVLSSVGDSTGAHSDITSFSRLPPPLRGGKNDDDDNDEDNDNDNDTDEGPENHVTKHRTLQQPQSGRTVQDHVTLPNISALLALPETQENSSRVIGEFGSSENSPISILSRRNIFTTSNSRCSTRGRDDEPLVNGMTPNKFHFNSNREVTDPYAIHDNTNKINISSLLNGGGEEVYTLKREGDGSTPTSIATTTYLTSSQDNEPSSSAPQGFGGLMDVDEEEKLLQQTPQTQQTQQTHQNQHKTQHQHRQKLRAQTPQRPHYIPPPPPKYINSKLDEIRTRVLLNPGSSSSINADDDLGAAAIISKMRSSPYQCDVSDPSRPNSSSHIQKSYPRPVIRIHQKEYIPDGHDEHAIIDDDDFDTEDEEDEDYNPKDKKNNFSKSVTTNSNAKKRGHRRRSVPSTEVKRRHSSSETVTSRHSSMSSTSSVTSLLSAAALLGIPSVKLKEQTERPRRKNTTGSRSRTGCWICRLRKKKCTEEKPHCNNCTRLNLECFYDIVKPDFITDPAKKNEKLEEIKKKTKEAKRMAMRKKPF